MSEMLAHLPPDLLEVAAWAGIALAAGAGLVLGLRAIRVQREVQRELESRLGALERDLGALCSSTSSAGDRLVDVEKRARELLARQEHLDTTGEADKSYRHAVALLERGATTEELVHTCGLARGEAELVAFLHRSQS